MATLPALIEFLIDRRKRKERIALSLDDLDVGDIDVPLAGLDGLLRDIADLIDRAKHPDAYDTLRVGNEILIIGPNLNGKKALARRIAKEAGMDRLIVVYNPRNADALAKAKSLIVHYRRQKVMLLLPRLDHVAEHEDDEVFAELDALIDTTSNLSNTLVVGTAVVFEPNGLLDNMFGIVLALPGTPLAARTNKALISPRRRGAFSSMSRSIICGRRRGAAMCCKASTSWRRYSESAGRRAARPMWKTSSFSARRPRYTVSAPAPPSFRKSPPK